MNHRAQSLCQGIPGIFQIISRSQMISITCFSFPKAVRPQSQRELVTDLTTISAFSQEEREVLTGPCYKLPSHSTQIQHSTDQINAQLELLNVIGLSATAIYCDKIGLQVKSPFRSYTKFVSTHELRKYLSIILIFIIFTIFCSLTTINNRKLNMYFFSS